VLSGLQPGEWRDVKFAEMKSLLKAKPQKLKAPQKESSEKNLPKAVPGRS
jgi:phenylalanyl-tRNA synthetase beta subunit